MTNIFSARFEGLDTLADIRRLITVQPDPVTGLEELSPALAAERLSEVGVWGAMEPKTNVSPTTCARCLLPRHPPR